MRRTLDKVLTAGAAVLIAASLLAWAIKEARR